MAKSGRPEVNLSILKDLVASLESTVQNYGTINQKEKPNDYIIELCKAAGIASGVMQEAAALVGDFHRLARLSQGIGKKPESEILSLEDLLSGLKGDGSSN